MSDDARRRLDAKKFNEHVKLGTTVNAIAVFVLIAGFLQPVIQEGAFSLVAFVWDCVGDWLTYRSTGHSQDAAG